MSYSMKIIMEYTLGIFFIFLKKMFDFKITKYIFSFVTLILAFRYGAFILYHTCSNLGDFKEMAKINDDILIPQLFFYYWIISIIYSFKYSIMSYFIIECNSIELLIMDLEKDIELSNKNIEKKEIIYKQCKDVFELAVLIMMFLNLITSISITIVTLNFYTEIMFVKPYIILFIITLFFEGLTFYNVYSVTNNKYYTEVVNANYEHMHKSFRKNDILKILKNKHEETLLDLIDKMIIEQKTDKDIIEYFAKHNFSIPINQ